MAACEMLTEDVWRQIFAFLSLKDLRNSATLVCKSWFNIIRNDAKLSGVLTIGNDKCKEITHMPLAALLSKWPKLKTLRFNCGSCFSKLAFENCPLLENVVYLRNEQIWTYKELLMHCKEICKKVRDKDWDSVRNEGFPLKMEINLLFMSDAHCRPLRNLEAFCETTLKYLESLAIYEMSPDNNHEMSSELRKIIQLVLMHVPNLRSLETWYDSKFIVETVAKRSALRQTNVQCPKLEEISLKSSQVQNDLAIDFLEHLLRFPKLKSLTLFGGLGIQIPHQARFNAIKVLRLDNSSLDDWKQAPSAFPNIKEIVVHYGYTTLEWYQALKVKKDVRGFLDLISVLDHIENLRYFKWEITVSQDQHVEDWETKHWWNTLEENGHHILETMKKLHFDCFVNIELKAHFDHDEVIKNIQTFVKTCGGKPYWIKHRIQGDQSWAFDRVAGKFDSTIVCSGEPGCQCKAKLYDTSGDLEDEGLQ